MPGLKDFEDFEHLTGRFACVLFVEILEDERSASLMPMLDVPSLAPEGVIYSQMGALGSPSATVSMVHFFLSCSGEPLLLWLLLNSPRPLGD